MSPLLQLITSAFVLAAVAVWITDVGAYPLLKWLSRFQYRLSSGFWFAAGLLPASVGVFVGLLALASGWLSARHWIPDHCLEHSGHPHLCLTHIGDLAPGGLLFWLILISAMVSVGYALISTGLATARLFGIPNGLNEKDGFYLYPSPVPAAFTAGLLAPRAYLSTRASEVLDIREKAVILAHEREHIRRRDPLRLSILHFLERWIPGGRYVRVQWQSASERECDEAALKEGFSAELIARTILKLQRATQPYLHAGGALNYAGRESGAVLRLRIEALFCDTERFSVGMKPVLLSVCVLSICGVAFIGDVHHILETVLGWLI